MANDDINYTATPTVAQFMLSDSFIRWILGPVGSGKTTGTLFEVLRRCCEQAPGPDGFRRTRFAIVRNTLSQMKQTVLKDVEMWLGGIAYYKSSENLIQIRCGDIISDWYLIPLDEPENQQRLLSLQLTGAWINEFIEIDPELIPAIAGRCGRFPSAAQGGASWFGIVGDSNMPNKGSVWHELLDVTVPEDWGVFIQPSGLADNAENLCYLTQTAETLKLALDDPKRLEQGRSYYTRLQRQQSASWVKRYVLAQYGDDPDGTTVFRESFSRSFHVTRSLEPSMGHMLIVGQDFGRNPCSVITQLDHKGRWLILEELIADNVGLEQHILTALHPALQQERYLGKSVVIVGDPAGKAKNTHYEETSFDLLTAKGFTCFPAPTNDVDPRIRAVEAYLLRNVAGKAQMLIDEERCPTLIRALDSKYIFGKTKVGQSRPRPEKTHPWSDVVDALQYAALCVGGNYNAVLVKELTRKAERIAQRGLVTRPRVTSKAWT